MQQTITKKIVEDGYTTELLQSKSLATVYNYLCHGRNTAIRVPKFHCDAGIIILISNYQKHTRLRGKRIKSCDFAPLCQVEKINQHILYCSFDRPRKYLVDKTLQIDCSFVESRI